MQIIKYNIQIKYYNGQVGHCSSGELNLNLIKIWVEDIGVKEVIITKEVKEIV